MRCKTRLGSLGQGRMPQLYDVHHNPRIRRRPKAGVAAQIKRDRQPSLTNYYAPYIDYECTMRPGGLKTEKNDEIYAFFAKIGAK